MPINRWNVALKPGGHYWINQHGRLLVFNDGSRAFIPAGTAIVIVKR